MGKASSNKKVARVARTGGGRTARGRGSLVWPGVLTLTVVLGTSLIFYSRAQNQTISDNLLVHCGVWGIQLYPAPLLPIVQNNVIDRSGGGVVFGGSDRFTTRVRTMPVARATLTMPSSTLMIRSRRDMASGLRPRSAGGRTPQR